MSSTTLSKQDIKWITADLSRLDKTQPGLGDDAIRHAINGDRDSVFSSLAHNPGHASGLVTPYSAASKADEKGLEGRWLFLHKGTFDPDVWWRYGQILYAMDPSNYMLEYYAPGSKLAPAPLKLILMSWAQAKDQWYGIKKAIKGSPTLTIARIRDVAEAGKADLIDVADIVLRPSLSYGPNPALESVKKSDECKQFMKDNPETVVAAIARMTADDRTTLINELGRWGMLGDETYSRFVMDQAFGSAKTTRAPAQSQLLTIEADRLKSECQKYLETGNATQRAQVAPFMAKALGESARSILEAHKEKEKGTRVRDAIDSALATFGSTNQENIGADDATGYVALDGTRIEIPPMPVLPELDPLPEGTEDKLREAVQFHNVAAKAHNEKYKKENVYWKAEVYPQELAGLLLEWLETGKTNGSLGKDRHKNKNTAAGIISDLTRLDTAKAAKLVQTLFSDLGVARLCMLHAAGGHGYHRGHFGQFFSGYSGWGSNNTGELSSWIAAGGDYRIVAHLIAQYGKEKANEAILDHLGNEWLFYSLDDVPSDSLWPFVAENLDAIDTAFGMRPWEFKASRHTPHLVRALELLEFLPKTPQRYLLPLLEIATGTAKTYRQRARNLLADAVGIDDHIINLLGDKKQETRAGAAEWAAQRGMTNAVKALHKVAKKEKMERPKAAFITALRSLGENVDSYLSQKKLKEEAEAGLKKIKPKDLDWFPFASIPTLKWKSGRKVDPQIPQWWIVLANKLKQPKGNGLFELYLAELQPDAAATLGLFLMDAFITHDTQSPTLDEANAYAEANADQTYQVWKRWDDTMTREKAYAMCRNEKLAQYLSSASKSQGILGLATKADGVEAAARVRMYLKTHGARTSQSRALLSALAGNPAPAAIQVVLSASERLKQKTTMTFAQDLIKEIADDRGWTPAQLADRTTPACGLDQTGALELRMGMPEKYYVARFDGIDKLTLENADGKTIKSLPTVKSDDDDVMVQVRATKKLLSTARKELKQVATLQKARLYEAMCAGRQWDVDEWQRYLHEHPVVGRFVQRLVWQARDENGTVTASFRPLGDGGLSDNADEDVSLETAAIVELAHSATLDETDRKAWQQHLEDYEIEPLFEQLNRPLIALDDAQADEREISDREGWLMEFLTMRGRAAKLGYENGTPEDGGFYYTWEKTFPTSGLKAIVEFTGAVAGAADENETAAIKSLSFVQGKGHRSVKLSKVPSVLVSECWSDYRQIADGGAYDAEWEKKVSWGY